MCYWYLASFYQLALELGVHTGRQGFMQNARLTYMMLGLHSGCYGYIQATRVIFMPLG